MFCFGTIPNIPCLVQTGYVVIVISPMVAPLENRMERVGTSQADDFCKPSSVIKSLFLVKYFFFKSSILMNGILPLS